MGLTKKSLLIIEDDPNLMELMKEYCEDLNILPIPAADATTGLALAETDKPDAIAVDHRLPDLSGLDVIQRLKSNPATTAIPVLFASADATLHEREARSRGAMAILLKPVTPDALRKALDQAWGPW